MIWKHFSPKSKPRWLSWNGYLFDIVYGTYRNTFLMVLSWWPTNAHWFINPRNASHNNLLGFFSPVLEMRTSGYFVESDFSKWKLVEHSHILSDPTRHQFASGWISEKKVVHIFLLLKWIRCMKFYSTDSTWLNYSQKARNVSHNHDTINR